jgi:hypothetical protein
VGCHHSPHPELSLFFYLVSHTGAIFGQMYNGLECSNSKATRWHNCPSQAAWDIVVLHLFKRVSCVSEEVMEHFGINPFANGYALAQQVIAEMVSVAGPDHTPIIWRTQPSMQTRYVTALEVSIATSQLMCTWSLFSTPSSSEDCSPEPLARLTHRDMFCQILRGHSSQSKSTSAIVVIWNQKISQLLQQSEGSDLEGYSVPVKPIPNVLYILRAQIGAYHTFFNRSIDIPFETIDATGSHIFSRIYGTEKSRLEFKKKYDKHVHKEQLLTGMTQFQLELAGAERSDIMTHATHFSNSCMPTQGVPRLIWEIQVTECKRLMGIVEKAGLHFVDEPREPELNNYHGDFATFPLYLADRFGIWCPEFSRLLLMVYTVYEETVLQYQNQNETPEDKKEKIRRDLFNFLNCFSFEKVSVPSGFLKLPVKRKHSYSTETAT